MSFKLLTSVSFRFGVVVFVVFDVKVIVNSKKNKLEIMTT